MHRAAVRARVSQPLRVRCAGVLRRRTGLPVPVLPRANGAGNLCRAVPSAAEGTAILEDVQGPWLAENEIGKGELVRNRKMLDFPISLFTNGQFRTPSAV